MDSKTWSAVSWLKDDTQVIELHGTRDHSLESKLCFLFGLTRLLQNQPKTQVLLWAPCSTGPKSLSQSGLKHFQCLWQKTVF